MKAPKAKTNTHLADIKGIIATNRGMARTTITVRFTSDALGETISLTDEDSGLMMSVPFEKVDKLIKETRGAK